MLNNSLTLPCGITLNNRLAKAAMTERLSGTDYSVNDKHLRLYERWAESKAGLMISGNILIDKMHLESAGNIVAENEANLSKLQALTATGTKYGQQFWAQLNHAGRQTNRFTNTRPLAPSGVQLKKLGLFAKPQTMTEVAIQDIQKRFVDTARICKKAGFTGVQFHAAHGYLLSQFLSPRTNMRTDQWGGSLENRSRLLINILRQARETLGSTYPISLKLNSADFQRGGFSEDESLELIQTLNNEGIDLLEVSGGTYEQAAFFNVNKRQARESTRKREAYFLDFARKVKEVSQIPLMVTGGFRTYSFANTALQNGELDVVGMARPFLLEPDKISGFLNGKTRTLANPRIRTGIMAFEDAAEGGYYARQLHLLSEGKDPDFNYHPLLATSYLITLEARKAFVKRFSKK